MSLLDNESIKKYFGCEPLCHFNHKDSCQRAMALRILKAMEEPIKSGERTINLDTCSWHIHSPCEHLADGDSGGYHPMTLRIPSQFQCRCAQQDICVVHPEMAMNRVEPSRETCPICHRCGEPLDKPGVKDYQWDKDGGTHSCIHKFEQKPDPVEAMIEHISDFYLSQGSFIKIKDKLRELVELVRKEKCS